METPGDADAFEGAILHWERRGRAWPLIMALVIWARGGQRSIRWCRAWMVVVVGVGCVFTLSHMLVPSTFTPPSTEHGGREKKDMMDGDDDGKVIGRADKEGESETEIVLRRNDEERRETDDDGLGDGDEYGRNQKIYDDLHSVENEDDYDEENDDYDANIYDAEENGDEGKGKIKEGKQKRNPETRERTATLEDKQLREKHEEAEKEESKRRKTLFVTELQPDIDKPLDNPKIEEINAQRSRKENVGRGGRLVVSGEAPLTFNGNYAPNETLNGRPVVKVVLLAYQRSGSSYTGELLSSGDGAFYVFEPLHPWRRHFRHDADPGIQEDAARLLGDILDCSPEVIHVWGRMKTHFFRKRPKAVKDYCKNASLRVVKTIRARASFMLPWLALRQDVKMIHLVRDPRGILSSVKRGGKLWSDNNRNITLQCANIKDDLSLESLGPQRYLQVRYEDLVDRPMEETNRMFSFMGVALAPSVVTFVKKHSGKDPDPSLAHFRYLNTYRNLQYHHDHWRNELGRQEVQHIQEVCKDVMNLLQYHILPSS